MKRGFIEKDNNAYLVTTRLPRLRLAMTGVRGFTLIELLVVVLIIGILAAVALPQYEKIVIKTKVTNMLPWFKKLKEGKQLAQLAGSCISLRRIAEETGIDYEKITDFNGRLITDECGGMVLKINQDISIVHNDGSMHWTLRKGNYFIGLAWHPYLEKLYCVFNDRYKGEDVCKNLGKTAPVDCGIVISYGGLGRASRCYEIDL